MKKLMWFVLITVFFSSGCATNMRKAATYHTVIQQSKTIAVMPPNMRLHKIMAGGNMELIDEWSETANKLMGQAIKEKFSDEFNFQLKFIDENWLLEQDKELWREYKALYHAVAVSAIIHGIYPAQRFSSKKENFDYTLGKNIRELSDKLNSDLLLFSYGEEFYSTGGRIASSLFTTAAVAALTGGTVVVLPTSVPDNLYFSLVNGTTGQVEWIRALPPTTNKSFKKEKGVKKLVDIMTKNMLQESQRSSSKK